ncbi:MAG: response regulator [Victivallaceae bacterium]|nr:response regulator [Victivallaceae bacterium]
MEFNRRILIVDDQSDLREQLAQLLLNSGRQNKTAQLVKSMRARLMGFVDAPDKNRDAMPKYDIDTAGQGQEAFEMVQVALKQNAPYAMMFVDMRMPPGWDGIKTAQEIRRIDSNIEIVMMTAYADYTQEDMVREIGSPEKMLFIKKPFHSEEICQFAYSLCAKWNNLMIENIRRRWLEKLVLNLRKIKQQDTSSETYHRIMEAYLGFFHSTKGFAAEWLPDRKEWVVHTFSGFPEQKVILKMLKQNQTQMLDTNAQSEIEKLQIIPLREHGTSVFIAIADAETSEDPTWFQCVNMLNLASLDQIEFIRKIEQRLSGNLPVQVKELRQIADGLKRKYADDPEILKLSTLLNEI